MEGSMSILGQVRNRKLNFRTCPVLPLRDAVEAHKSLVTGDNIKGTMVFVVDKSLAA